MFLTSRMRVTNTGGFKIRDRRRKPDEPFNPFAANANQVRQKKRSERNSSAPPSHAGQQRTPTRQTAVQDDLRRKQEEARKRLGAQVQQAKPSVQKPAVDIEEIRKTDSNNAPQQVSRADRLAELRKQSQESVKKTESILEPKVTPATNTIEETVKMPEATTQETIPQEVVGPEVEILPEIESSSSKNVFKQIVTKTPKKREHRRRRSRYDDGGGRQPKVKKLNRQRYNDYKYAARDILDNESVAEEHRSNLLGQIWAKGERIGVEASFDFIEEKQEQLIISPEIAEQLRVLVKALTTKR